ncbi:MAG: hypothetical protein ACKOPU_01360 [Candidatus Planktophila sp.]
MESLALLVALILAVVMFSGPLGILLTINPVWNATLKVPALWYARRILISLLAAVGMIFGFQVLLGGVPFMASLMVMSGMAFNLVAIKLEYQIGKFNKRATPGTPGASEL